MTYKNFAAIVSSVWAFWALFAVAAILGFLSLTDALPRKDGAEYTRMGHFLASDGVLSTGQFDQNGDPLPTMNREPTLPAIYATAMWLAGVETPAAACIEQDAAGDVVLSKWGDPIEICGAALTPTRVANLVLFLSLIALMYFGTRLVLEPAGLRLLAAGVVGLGAQFSGELNSNYTEILAAFLLLGASLSLHAAYVAQHAQWRWAAIAGLTLALLILTRPVFVYVWPIVLLFTGLIALRARAVAPLVKGALIVLVAYGASGLYMSRNAALFSEYAVATDRNVFAVRAEYNAMTWNEWRSAWTRYSPIARERTVGGPLNDDPNDRMNRNNPNGHYRAAMERRGLAAAATGKDDPTTKELKSAALSLIVNDPLGHLTTTPLFAYRAMFPASGRGYQVVQDVSWRLWKLQKQVTALFIWPAIPIGIALFFMWVGRGDFEKVLLIALPLFSFGLYSLMTHNIPRYSQPLTPILLVTAIWAVASAIERWRSGGASTGAPRSAEGGV